MSSIVLPGARQGGAQRGRQEVYARNGQRKTSYGGTSYTRDETHGSMRNEVSGEKRDALNRILSVVIIGLSLILLFELAFHSFIAPKMIISDIRISAPESLDLTRQDLLNIAGLEGRQYYFSLEHEEIARNLESYPLIKTANVSKVFPSTLDIAIDARSPLALALVPAGDLMVPVTLDEDGVVFEMGAGVSNIDLPVISGLKFADPELGMRLPEELNGYLRQLKTLKERDPLLFDLISEFKFVKKNRSGYEVLLYPASYPVRIRTGSAIDARLVRYVMMVLDVVAKQGITGSVEEIDFRTNERGSVVYRMREG